MRASTSMPSTLRGISTSARTQAQRSATVLAPPRTTASRSLADGRTTSPPRLVPPYVGPASASFPSVSASSLTSRGPQRCVQDSFRRLTMSRRGFVSSSSLPPQTGKQGATRGSSEALLGAVAAASTVVLLTLYTSGQVFADDAKKDDDGTTTTKKKDDEGPTLLVLLGSPRSGKSTQAQRLSKRFNLPIHPSSSSPTPPPETQLYIYELADATPSAVESLEKGSAPIWCILFFDLPLDAYRKRFPDDDEGAKKLERQRDDVIRVVKRFRDQGNILEISADWESPDEVWEQVEAKVEQILELKERGEELGC
ncbi:uncharacterized protein PFL1_01033 [Pseudozyma flocculosa PF-1]|uniref:P-loop containing nucleoside triphosphate hydrolase protein n=1 Tax=Pseudozyma flocculosa TaxID=84751 RepID=A0A5C3FAZ9_9BASI|nr:uncharacterized protein PFL1_01033 [Pseudozyma flocculosa PF-1]EPQ31700.1 hypothetical protein PFL1_01033 [Pseudozyma flocculosa PF-1]SPO40817.1 uncharacterized protein PSFLO_06299 [Pseudozyma flocculosa]